MIKSKVKDTKREYKIGRTTLKDVPKRPILNNRLLSLKTLEAKKKKKGIFK